MLATSKDRIGRPADAVDVFAADATVLLHQIGHGIVNAMELRAANTCRTRGFRAAAIEHGIMLGHQLFCAHVDADIDAVMEGDAFALDLLDAAIDEVLLHLEVGNAIAQQATGLGFALIDMHLVTGTAKLLGSGKTGRAGTDDRNLLAGVDRGRLRHDEAQLIGLVGNRLFHRLDRNGRIFEVQRAGFLARSRTDTAGKFREVVGGMEVADRLLPIVVVDQIVPVGDLVVHRAAGRAVAVRNATVHAARRLLLHLGIRHGNGEFPEMANTIRRRLILANLTIDLQKTCNLAHVSVPSAA